MAQWYAASLAMGSTHRRCAENLANLGYESWYPMVRERKGEEPKPYLHGYIFVKAEPDDLPPKGTRGMGRLLGLAGPLRIMDREMKKFMDLCEKAEVAAEADTGMLSLLQPGDRIAFEHSGVAVRGTVEKQQGLRVRAMMSIFGRQTPVMLHRKDIVGV